MGKLSLTMSCGDYDRTRAFLNGSVVPEGIDLNVIPLLSPERHRRMMRNMEFDVCELSAGDYLVGRALGKPITAIPVFPHRRFRHSYVFVNADAGIEKPQDLRGKRVGISNYTNGTAMWMRGILQQDYGVRQEEIIWVRGNPEDVDEWRPPDGVTIESRPPGASMADLLVSGRIQAQIHPEVIEPFKHGSPKVRRLFPNYREVEMDYYCRIGVYPIMHFLVIRDEILQRYPWVAVSMLKAWQRAKELCYEYLSDQRKSSLVWFGSYWEEQKALMGPDPWPYNLRENRKALETLLDYACEQRLLSVRPVLESLFDTSTLEEAVDLAH